MTNRRNFLKQASLFTLGGLFAGKAGNALAAEPAVAESMAAKKRIGLQIYSLGGELYEGNVAANLKKLGKMGYTHLELAGFNEGKIGSVPMMDFKKMTEDAGMKITSTHQNPPVREYTSANKQQIADFWKKTADYHAKLEVDYVVQPGLPSTRNVEEVKRVCEVFNEAGQICKERGMRFGYHNHEMEFAKVVPGGADRKFGRHEKGEMIEELFIKNTDPSLVMFELDVYWAVMGQQDPVEWLKKYSDRIRLLHIKDSQVLGQSGMMNFERIFQQAYSIGIKDFYVELEHYRGGSQYEGVKGCVDYLLKSSFVK